MTDEVSYSADVILYILGEGQRATHQPRDPLSEGVIEALDVIGFAGALGDGFVLRSQNPAGVGSVLVGIKCRPLTLYCRNLGP